MTGAEGIKRLIVRAVKKFDRVTNWLAELPLRNFVDEWGTELEDIEASTTASPYPEDRLLEEAENVFQNECFFIEPREWHFWNTLRRWETKKEFYGL